MIKSVLERLIKNNEWKYFIEYFEDMKAEVLHDLLTIDFDQKYVIEARAKLEVLDEIIGLDSRIRKEENIGQDNLSKFRVQARKILSKFVGRRKKEVKDE